MPIYEFKCSKCEEFFELLTLGSDEKHTSGCPKCHSMEFERVLSVTNHSMGGGSKGAEGTSSKTRTCSGGSCTTYEIPGHTK